MIKIKVTKESQNISEIIVKGHSNYAEYGNNIVCASISVVTISIINGLTEVCKINNLDITQNNGYIKLKIGPDLSKKEKIITNLFLKTLLLSFKQIKEEYPKEIELKIKEG